ncbi:MAG: mandelate racemase/muconate lactonizing enzyme family protein, partial [Caldimonas sp.]
PHYLGAGVGLTASAHALAACGSDDELLEIDSNDNPLRTRLCPPLASLAHGRIALGDAVGLGIEPSARDLRELAGSR